MTRPAMCGRRRATELRARPSASLGALLTAVVFPAFRRQLLLPSRRKCSSHADHHQRKMTTIYDAPPGAFVRFVLVGFVHFFFFFFCRLGRGNNGTTHLAYVDLLLCRLGGFALLWILTTTSSEFQDPLAAFGLRHRDSVI